jgi:hypothetical protein
MAEVLFDRRPIVALGSSAFERCLMIVLGSILALGTACGGALNGGTMNLKKPTLAPPSHGVRLTVRDAKGPVVGAYCWLDGVTDHASGPSDRSGTIVFAYVPLSLRDAQLNCKADGYQPFSEHRLLSGEDPEPALVAVLDARQQGGPPDAAQPLQEFATHVPLTAAEIIAIVATSCYVVGDHAGTTAGLTPLAHRGGHLCSKVA